MPDDRLPTVLLGALVGVLVGALLVAGAGAWILPTDRVASPSSSMATATGCRPNPTAGGWVGHVVVGDHAVVVFNDTLVHDAPALDVRATLSDAGNGRYVYAITTSPATDGKEGQPPGDCRPRTTVDASVTLPSWFDALTITVDGRPVASVSSTDATPSFRAVEGSPIG